MDAISSLATIALAKDHSLRVDNSRDASVAVIRKPWETPGSAHFAGSTLASETARRMELLGRRAWLRSNQGAGTISGRVV